MGHALSKKWELSRIARRHMEELDSLVHQRTVELQQSNQRLKAEIEQRKSAEEQMLRAQRLESIDNPSQRYSP